MEKEEYEKITKIFFPNTVSLSEQSAFRKSEGFSFTRIMEAGEMAGIAWIGVFRDGVKVAQIKQSVCDIFFN